MKWVKILLVFLPFTCLTLVLIAVWLVESGSLREWESLGVPPGGAEKFVDANATYVYVRNKSGTLFRCPKCWEEAQPLEKPLIDQTRTCQSLNVRIPPAPGEVVDRVEGRECLADATADFQYVIFSDGSVWAWSFYRGAYTFFLYPLLAICACLVGFIPLVLAIVIGKIKGKSAEAST